MSKKNENFNSLMESLSVLNEEEFNVSAGDVVDIKEEPVDDVTVEPIIDPELDAYDDLTAIKSEDYIGKFVVVCGVCGNSFFNDSDDVEAITCPTCQSESDELTVVGKVVSKDAAEATGETVPEDGEDDTADKTDEAAADGEPEDKPADEDEDGEYEYEEENFEKLFTQFLTDSYKNVKSFKLSEAKVADGCLTLSGKAVCEGKDINIMLTSDPIKLDEGKMVARLGSPMFGKAKAFVVEHVIKENRVTPTKMNWRFRTRQANESYEVYGKATIQE